MNLKFTDKKVLHKMPSILYKYRVWESNQHKRLLTNGEVYYASPNDFQELTECNLEWDYGPDTNVSNEIIKNRKMFEEDFKKDIYTQLSIFSASTTPLNLRLWNTFANNCKGFCVGIDFSKIYGLSDLFGTCGPVSYYDEKAPPKIKAGSSSADERVLKLMEIMYSLPDKFKDEEEFRFTKLNIKKKRVVLESNWIREVILGSEIDPVSEVEIVKLVKQKYPHAKLKKLFIEPTFGIISVVDFY